MRPRRWLGASPRHDPLESGEALARSWLGDKDGAQKPLVAVRPTGALEFEHERVVYSEQDGDGCPHDGPSLAVVGDSLHVSGWMLALGHNGVITRVRS